MNPRAFLPKRLLFLSFGILAVALLIAPFGFSRKMAAGGIVGTLKLPTIGKILSK